MEGISDIRITGIDEKRPPKIRKEPYIDIYFKLSHKAPVDWCKRFNELLAKHSSSPKIDVDEGLYVQTWVRTPDEIAAHLKLLNEKVADCTLAYIEKVQKMKREADNANADTGQELGEQGRLNRILSDLKFDAPAQVKPAAGGNSGH